MLVKITGKGWPELVIRDAVSVPRIGEHVIMAPGIQREVRNVKWVLPPLDNGEVVVSVEVDPY